MSSAALLKQLTDCKDAAAAGSADGDAAAAAAAAGPLGTAAEQQQMLQRMLPRYNAAATCAEDLFCLEDCVPLLLLNDGSAETGTAAAPLLQLLQQEQQQQEQQQQQAAQWGQFIVAAANYVALQRNVGGDRHLSKQLSLQQLARLLKILKFLCLLLHKQKHSFANQIDVRTHPSTLGV